MSGKSDDDIEGIANRLALLVSETGEADNAGRAVGALARRVGLSGGDLKAIFLAGANSLVARAGIERVGERNGGERGIDPREMAAMARRISALRHSLTLAEVAIRNAERERDNLRLENETLQASLQRREFRGRAAQIAGGLLLTAIAAGVVYVIAANAMRDIPGALPAVAASAAQPSHLAVVREGGARVYAAPNKLADVLTTAPPGTHLNVRRLVVNVLLQWAEVDLNNTTGYVVTTDLSMP